MLQKQWAAVLIFLALAVVLGAIGWAQQPPGPGPGGPGMMGPGMPGMGPGMPGMPGMMMPQMMMMGRSALAVQGQYIYVLAGNSLLKYDTNLRLVRKTDIGMDMGPRPEMMHGGAGGPG